jgi:hypothetical protein
MDEKQYLSERLENQIDWYNQKSQYNQKWFKRLRLTEIICAALIPFLSASGEKIPYGTLLTGGLGIVIAISAAAGALYKFHENWIQFRSYAEQLEHEKFLYLTNTEPFNVNNKLPVLVQRVEGILSKENSSWAQSTKSQQQEMSKV